MLNDLHSCLLLRLLQLVKVRRLLLRLSSITKGSTARWVRTLRLGLGAHHVLLDSLLEHHQAIRLLVEHLSQLSLLKLASLMRYESTNKR